MAARLDADVLVVLGTNLAQLERGAHLTVELVLLLGHLDVVLAGVLDEETQVRVDVPAVGKQETETSETQTVTAHRQMGRLIYGGQRMHELMPNYIDVFLSKCLNKLHKCLNKLLQING